MAAGGVPDAKATSRATAGTSGVRSSMSIYSQKDLRHMTTPEGIVTADCQFCGAHYEFDPATLGFEAEKGRKDEA